jgi:hypothetical protein
LPTQSRNSRISIASAADNARFLTKVFKRPPAYTENAEKYRKKHCGNFHFYAATDLKKEFLYGIILFRDCDENLEEGRVWFKSSAIGNVR